MKGRGRGGGTARGAGPRRDLKTRVQNPGRRTGSSARWLARQHSDPYVAEARRSGYRSRAAFKLIQLDDRYRLLGRGARVVDLGAAPGGWTQVAVARCGGAGRVVGVDVGEVEPLAGAILLTGDIRDQATRARAVAALAGAADVVLSDMAGPATGHAQTDHLRVVALAEAALDFAEDTLAPGGAFVAKVLMGGAQGDLLKRLRDGFAKVRHAKPPASRAESAETYVIATGFRGTAPRD